MLHSKTTLQYADETIGRVRMQKLLDANTVAGKAPMLLVREIFSTRQGEAPYIGYPAVFIRLGGCNRGSKTAEVGCVGCDTDFRLSQSTFMPFNEVFNEACSQAANTGARLIVITGGEPLLQTGHLVPLLLQFHTQASHMLVQFETNGDLLEHFLDQIGSDPLAHSLYNLAIVVSPKATNGSFSMPDLNNVERGLRCVKRMCVRQVISGDAESPYYSLCPSVLDWAKTWGIGGSADPDIYLSPMTLYGKDGLPSFDRASIDRAKYLASVYRTGLSLQTHVIFDIE